MDVVSSTHSHYTISRSRSGGRRFWVIALAIVACELFIWGFAIASIAAHHGTSSDPGWRSELQGGAWIVSEVDPHGPVAATLHVGDEILRVNGKPLSWLGPGFRALGTYPGSTYSVEAKRNAQTFSFRLKMGAVRDNVLLDTGPNFFISSLLFLSGLWILFGGPGNITARLGSISFLVASLAILGTVFEDHPGWSSLTAWIAILLARIPRPVVLVFGWDFLSRFPQSIKEGSAARLLRYSFYGISIVLWLAINVPVAGELFNLPNFPLLSSIVWLGWEGPFGQDPNAIFDGLISLGTCYVLIRNYRLLTDAGSRRKIRWAAAAYGLGAICLLSLRLLQLVASASTNPFWGTAANVADAAMILAVGLLPIALTYAVVKHRVLGVRLVIRRGLQYLLAKNVLRLIVFAPALIVLAQILREPNESISDLVFRSSWRFYLPLMGTAAFSLRYRRQLSKWLDRRFFRVALQEEEAWVALAESMKAATTESELADAVAHQFEMGLLVDGVHIFFRSASDGRLHATLSRSPRDTQLLCNELEENRALALGRDSVLIVSETPAGSDEAAAEREEELLVVPLLGSDGRNLGAFVLGPKKSEEPYTRKERELLQAVGAQVAMACEVLRLKHSIDQESRRRIAVLGRLDRENIQLLNECLKCGKCYDSSVRKCTVDGTPLELTLPVERVIVGRYRLDRRLGAGGMGVVYEAVDLRLDKVVAVKIITGELFGNRQALIRFKREAQAVASLRHPNIVGVHDFGPLPAEGAFLTMDLVKGFSWRRHLNTASALAPERVASWIEDLCSGVAAAHGSGIVHRDLKPENVMISNDGERETAMILDFGLAKLHLDSEKDGTVSVTGAVLGTRAYMSPEQRAGEKVGTATDIYTISVMTLETLSRLGPPNAGATAFWADNALARIVGPDSSLRAVLRLGLAETPEARIQRVEKLGSLLAAAIRLERPISPVISGSDDAETLSMGAIN
ncbi:MAG TPA: protein kinase [Bryobacteraceae bacterium]|nr:protein kinase [Bryobacteraceae bacterium]